MKSHKVRTRLFTRHTGCNSHLHPKNWSATEDKADPLARHQVGFRAPTQSWNCTPAISATSSQVLRGERASSEYHCHPSHSSSPAEEEQRMCTAHSSCRELPPHACQTWYPELGAHPHHSHAEHVFTYGDRCSTKSYLNHEPSGNTGLAFWKESLHAEVAQHKASLAEKTTKLCRHTFIFLLNGPKTTTVLYVTIFKKNLRIRKQKHPFMTVQCTEKKPTLT